MRMAGSALAETLHTKATFWWLSCISCAVTANAAGLVSFLCCLKYAFSASAEIPEKLLD